MSALFLFRSTFYTQNTQAARWNLRDQLENKSLEVNQEVVEAFESIDEELERLKSEIEAMSKTCETMRGRLNGVKETSGLAIQQANELFTSEESVEVQLALSQAFLAHFSLTPTQTRAIKSNEVTAELFDALRRVHVIYNHSQELLSGETQLQMRTGAEIGQQMSELLEIAYRKLYRWVRNETKFLEIYNDTEVPNLVVLAFEALQERPVLLAYCLDDVARRRSTAVVDGFMDALTVGGPNGIPRPIDMHAHDPKRYVGDMAAFIHQALAAELELLSGGLLRKVKKSAFTAIQQSSQASEAMQVANNASKSNPSSIGQSSLQGSSSSLKNSSSNGDINNITNNEAGHDSLGEKHQSDSIIGSNQPATLQPGHPQLHPAHTLTTDELFYKISMARLLNIELAGLCKPFQSRVEQVLANTPNPALLYHLANLCYYYSHILGTHLDPSAAISQTLVGCRESAYKAFFTSIGSRMNHLLHTKPPIPSFDLSPTHDFTEVVLLLQDLMRILDTSIIPAEEKEFEALPILDRIVDPLLESCVIGLKAANATLKPGPRGMPVAGSASTVNLTLHTMEQVVYLINCATSICKVLEKYPFAIVKLAQLKGGIDVRVASLVSEQATLALRACGLASKLELLQQHELSRQRATSSSPTAQQSPHSPSPHAPLCSVPGMDVASLQQTIRAFETDILELGALNMAQIDKIEDDRVRTHARRDTSTALTNAYTTLYNAVASVDSGYVNPDSILRYKPEQVHMMIAV